jgi:hypothetical protein
MSFVDDFAAHAAKLGISLADDARQLLLKLESSAESLDTWLDRSLILAVFIREVAPLRRVLLRNGLDPMKAADVAEADCLRHKGDKYHDADSDRYSSEDGLGNRALLGSTAIARARSERASQLSVLHLLAALLDTHDAAMPPLTNSDWTDEGLHVNFNTLSHIVGFKYDELWIDFEAIRSELGLHTPEAMRQDPIKGAPSHVKSGLLSFFADHPEYHKNCFLIMPFRETTLLSTVHNSIRRVLAEFGIQALRADDSIYSENLFTNIEIFMHGCKFAVSVIERASTDQHNANVALEVGYMLGLKKQVCLLKERTVVSLPSDLQGRLYIEFDMFAIKSTIRKNLGRWLRDRGIAMGPM